MSLVLEALKKLDRERGRDERGFVVMAAAPWPTRRRPSWPLWALAVAVAAAAVVFVAVRPARESAVPAPMPAAVPAPAATEVAAAAPLTAGVAAVGPPRAPRAAIPSPLAIATTAREVSSPSADASPGLRLQAISARDGQPIAIVNDHLVRVGDEFDGVRVLAIRATEVDVEAHGRRATLRF